MMHILIFITLFFISLANLNYPYACDCQEHKNSQVCLAHNCGWNNNQCEILKCQQRKQDWNSCVNGSQFYSENPYYCIFKNNKCVDIEKCEDIQLTMRPNQAREFCQRFLCAYDVVSGYCFKPTKCSDIYDENTCNNMLIGSIRNLPIQSICYWDDTCKESDNYAQDCTQIQQKGACIAFGCAYINNKCEELNCSHREIKDCNGEYVNSRGRVFQCFEKNDKCEEQESSKFNQKFCNEMVGHTWNEGLCQKCKSYNTHAK